MGFFHLKMACADAIWRIFLENKKARLDENSLMHFVALHHPKETGKIGSNPGFRRMHDIIQQEGTALHLDAWRTELAKRNVAWTSLELFAQSKQTDSTLRSIADSLATNYVAGSPNVAVWELRDRPLAERDAQRENTLLMYQYFLLYEATSHTMNYGDIGRVESLFPPWIAIFKATGKNKYAKSMCKYLNDVHWVYPKPLAHAVWYNCLVNPKGKKGCFRATDWVQELDNLKTKVSLAVLSFPWPLMIAFQVIFGESYANYTKDRVIAESSLIDIFHMCHSTIETNFMLGGLTTRHTPPDMRKNYHALTNYMHDNHTNAFQTGRKTGYSIQDLIDEGLRLLLSGEGAIDEGQEENETWQVEEGDVMAEL